MQDFTQADFLRCAEPIERAQLEFAGMSPAAILETAHGAGIRVRVDGGDLVLEAPAPPPPAVLDLLTSHKAALLIHLRSVADREAFEERAAILEFDGGLPREQAEAEARRLIEGSSEKGEVGGMTSTSLAGHYRSGAAIEALEHARRGTRSRARSSPGSSSPRRSGADWRDR